MKDTSNILFASVNLPILNKELAAEQLLKINSKLWFWNSYRATNMLPLMTKNAVGGEEGSNNSRNGEFGWLPYVPTVISQWFDNIVFPWMGCQTRIMALMTQPNFKNNEHIDCKLQEVGNLQHKFRIVLTGNTDTLYFKTTEGDIKVTDINLPFIMDGGWPHGMFNYSDKVKITLAAGAPWNGNNYYSDVNILLKRSEFEIPVDLSTYLKSS